MGSFYHIIPKMPSIISEQQRLAGRRIDEEGNVGVGLQNVMITLNWNIGGLGDLDKKAKVQDFIYLYCFDVIAL